jgi:magnesium transporter
VHEKTREAQLELLDDGLANELRELMAFPEGTAGRMMEPRVFSLPSRLTVRQALSKLRHMPTQDTATLVVTDDAGRLVGLLDLVDLVRANRNQTLAELLHGEPLGIDVLTPRDDVIELFTRYRLRLVPVVDIENRVVGVIREGMVVTAAQQEASADLQAMVGVSRDERALSSPFSAVRMRLPWLNINLLTAFLASAVVGTFEDTIARFTALAVLLPVVAGQSGNTGAQALVVVMRGLALREIRLRQWRRVLGKELLAGLLNGLAIALVTSLGVLVWSHSGGLAFVIGISMVLSMMLAGLAGAATPLVLTRLRQDPAQSASIILTTVTDVTGFLSFLGLATLFAGLL